MSTLDYIWLIAVAAGLIFGMVRGFLKIAFAFIGVVVISVATSYLSPYADKWLASAIVSDGTRALVAMLATFVVLSIVYGLVTKLINKLINKISILGWINRLLGAVVGVLMVYVVFSILTSLAFSTSDGLLAQLAGVLKPSFAESWVITNIYGGEANPDKNFFGQWLLENFVKIIEQYIPNTAD